MQKGQTPENGSALFKNNITIILSAQKPVRYSETVEKP